ncbi:hypothetical protein K3495_g2946 [Podosphaera aphanis]|nr:hypothetical protein K3495_g2946 [Podosphaera aphanis]
MSSLRERGAPPRTYSRRKSTIVNESSNKRRCVEDVHNIVHSSPSNGSENTLQTKHEKDSRCDIRNFLRSISSSPIHPSANDLPPDCSLERKKRRLKFTHQHTKTSPTTSKLGKPPPKLVQQTISNTGKEYTSCKACGMVYAFWEKKSHDLFHRKSANEFQPLVKNKAITIYKQGYEDNTLSIQVLDRNSEPNLRTIGERALCYSSDNGLEMEPLGSKKLWGLIPNPHDLQDPDLVLHYRLYTMFYGPQLIALLLAERIGHALPRYDDMERYTNQNSIKNRYKVYMSVDRIWVLPKYHRKGFATIILDQARKDFLDPLKLPKSEIAISWPTDDGNRFFEKYFSEASLSLDGISRYPYLINIMDTPASAKYEETISKSLS